MTFDPRQYVIDAGWDLESVQKTVALGIAEADSEDIRKMLLDDGVSEDEIDHAVGDACDALMQMCRERVLES